jgi:cytochrome c553
MKKKLMLSFIVVAGIGLTLYLVKAGAQMGGGMMGGGMMGPGQSSQGSSLPEAQIFNANCGSCHPNGGNTIMPNLPLKGAPQLADYNTFLSYIRHPTMPNGSPGPMPAFPPERISDEQARNLYQYLKSMEKTSGPGGPQWSGTRGYGPGPGMGGYGMGPGMMGYGGYGGYGMGPGMMGPGYGYGGYGGYGPQYQSREKPVTEKEAKTMLENYLKSTRNPNLKLGKIKSEEHYFEADIVTKKNNSLVDKILVDKSTGWMHSVY